MTTSRGLPVSIVLHSAVIAALLWPHHPPAVAVVEPPRHPPILNVIPQHITSVMPAGRPEPVPQRKARPTKRIEIARRIAVKEEPPPPETKETPELATETDEPEATGTPSEASPGAGDPSGVAGVVGEGFGGGVPSGPLPFDDKMTPPRRISGPDPAYTMDALEHEVQGEMLVRCIVGLDGAVRDCRIVRGLPFMDRAVVDALQHRRYEPARLGGRPVEVDYTFRLELRLP
ncbi:MAG TPA: TonB family protein [Myxococcales bacterium]|jgi:protein TonB